MRVRLAVALLPMLFGGCGAPGAQDAVGDSPLKRAATAEETSTELPEVHGLTCQNEMRGAGTFDFVPSTGGKETPDGAAKVLAKGDDVVVEGQTKSRASAYLLRADGTAYSRLDLIVLSDGTWRIEGIESCSGEGPLGK